MKKAVWAVIGAISVVIVIVAVVMVVNNSTTKAPSKSDEAIKESSNFQPAERKACDILTPDIAQKIAGADAAANETPNAGANSSDISVTNCNYYSVSTKNGANLLVRAALTEDGAMSNHHQFHGELPSGAQKVSGYGDSAYWDTTTGQLNIFKNNNWYIVQAGGITPAGRTLDQTKTLADLIIASL